MEERIKTDILQNMKSNGNTLVNKTYNPKNKKPDMPLDADEVDGAMERYIRKKYQEKSLSHGKPQPPSRNNEAAPVMSRSPENSPPPPLPPKKGRFFGFGLRASSSAYPLSKRDKKKMHQSEDPRVDSAWRIASDDFGSSRLSTEPRRELSDGEMMQKLAQLGDMGFPDIKRNTSVLRRLDGDVERAVEALVQLGPAARRSPAPRAKARPAESLRPTASASNLRTTAGRPTDASNNPFDQLDQRPTTDGFGLSLSSAQQSQQDLNPFGLPPPPPPSNNDNNPFVQQPQAQTSTSLEQTFQNMQVSQPLFVDGTAGHPPQAASMQDPRFQQSMTPPALSMPAQYGLMAPAAAAATSNPFFQSMQPPQSTGGNQYGVPQQVQQSMRSSSNPFFNQQPPQQQPQHQAQQPIPEYNPFGMPQQQTTSQSANSYQSQPSIFDSYQSTAQSDNMQQNPFLQHTNQSTQFPAQPSFPSFDSNQYQAQPQSQTQQPQFQTQHPSYNSQPQYQQQQQSQFQPQQPQQQHRQHQQYQQQSDQIQPQYQFRPQQQPLMPQQTGRYDKSSILALYNHPHLAPQLQQNLSSIPEPFSTDTQSQQPVSPTPQGNPFSGIVSPGRRSATMPVSAMHSAGGGGSRNPFTTGSSSRHVSADSQNVNNLDAGRHSPDAFTSLSARYGR